MNGWLDPDPAWWFNLQANPNATVLLANGRVGSGRGRRSVGASAPWAMYLGSVPRRSMTRARR